MMIRTRGRRLVSRLENLERVYGAEGPHEIRVLFDYGDEPTIVHIFLNEHRTEIIEPPDPPDDDPDEFSGALKPATGGDLRPPRNTEPRASASVKKPGAVLGAVRGRDALSMTCGRRGGLSQGFFTDPRASGPSMPCGYWGPTSCKDFTTPEQSRTRKGAVEALGRQALFSCCEVHEVHGNSPAGGGRGQTAAQPGATGLDTRPRGARRLVSGGVNPQVGCP